MELRVSLIIIGGAIILAIYLLGRRGLQADELRPGLAVMNRLTGIFRRLRESLRRDDEMTPVEASDIPHAVSEPVIDPAELAQLETMIPARGGETISAEEIPAIIELSSEQIAPAGEQLFIPLTIMAKNGGQLSGERISEAMNAAGLILKEDGIYRFEIKDTQGYQQVLLGLANILEPGSFDATRLDQLSTPGLVLYLHLPAPIEARAAFDKLIEIGHQLEALLEAELCDETRSVLTKQTIGHLQEKIEAFRFKQKMTQLQRRRT